MKMLKDYQLVSQNAETLQILGVVNNINSGRGLDSSSQSPIWKSYFVSTTPVSFPPGTEQKYPINNNSSFHVNQMK